MHRPIVGPNYSIRQGLYMYVSRLATTNTRLIIISYSHYFYYLLVYRKRPKKCTENVHVVYRNCTLKFAVYRIGPQVYWIGHVPKWYTPLYRNGHVPNWTYPDRFGTPQAVSSTSSLYCASSIIAIAKNGSLFKAACTTAGQSDFVHASDYVREWARHCRCGTVLRFTIT